jgi:hypothetical protein
MCFPRYDLSSTAAMFALRCGAAAVKDVGMLDDLEAIFRSDQPLSLFHRFIMEFLNAAAGRTHEMVMVHPVIQLINGSPCLEVRLLEQAGLLQLCEHAVHGSQTDLVTLLEQQAIHLFGCQMTYICFLKHFQDLQPRQRGLQASVSEFG